MLVPHVKVEGFARSWRAVLAAVLTTVLFASLLVVVPLQERTPEAKAADSRNFDAGYLISDENFYDGRAMTEREVEAFLAERNPGCLPGARCIRNYRANTPSMPAGRYCSALPGRANESAASIITRVGQACNVSQKALLVLLEKEQSLISLQTVADWRWAAATGYACPDTAPCDSGFGGFFPQLYYGARQYQVYKVHPTEFRHQPAAWNDVLYNPNYGCGSSRVYIRNYATAGLYNYTPYQPNRAALNNLYGTGDWCSTYGNRNFWRLYTDWFGDPTAPKFTSGQLVTTSGTDRVWLVDGTTRFPIRWQSLHVFTNVLGQPRTVAPRDLQMLREGAWLDRSVGQNGRCWLLDGTLRYEYYGREGAAHFGIDCGKLPQVSNAVLHRWKHKDSLKQLAGWSGGQFWYVENGVRREVPNATAEARATMGLPSRHTWLSEDALFRIPVGAPLMPIGETARIVGTNETIVGTKQGFLRLTPEQSMLRAFHTPWQVQERSVSQIQNLIRLPDRISYHSTQWVVTSEGLVRVDSRQFGKHASFSKVQAPMLWGVRQGAPRMDGLLVQQRGQAQVWLIEGGSKRRVGQWELPSLRARYGGILITATDLGAGVPERAAGSAAHDETQVALGELPAGTLVEREPTGELFLLSEAGRVPVEDVAFVAALGLETAPIVVADESLDAIPLLEGALTSAVVTCDATEYVGEAGHVRAVTAEDAALAEEPRSALPADVCAVVVPVP